MSAVGSLCLELGDAIGCLTSGATGMAQIREKIGQLPLPEEGQLALGERMDQAISKLAETLLEMAEAQSTAMALLVVEMEMRQAVQTVEDGGT